MLSLMPRPVQSPARMTGLDPFIFSVDLVRRLQLVEFAHRVLTAAAHLTQPKRWRQWAAIPIPTLKLLSWSPS
jgi:hypothetical protein